jgi:hypothetical protein
MSNLEQYILINQINYLSSWIDDGDAMRPKNCESEYAKQLRCEVKFAPMTKMSGFWAGASLDGGFTGAGGAGGGGMLAAAALPVDAAGAVGVGRGVGEQGAFLRQLAQGSTAQVDDAGALAAGLLRLVEGQEARLTGSTKLCQQRILLPGSTLGPGHARREEEQGGDDE